VLGSGSWIRDPGLGILDSGHCIPDPGFLIMDWGLGFGMLVSGFWIQDSGSWFRILDSGCWKWDPGSWIDPGILDSGSILEPGFGVLDLESLDPGF
jgi:hypothetical protein